MTGPEHYREAERLLALAAEIPAHNDDTNPAAALTIAEAQVHATLALAAATIPAEEAPRAWYTTEELTPSGECAGGGEHEWLPEGNATYLVCHKGREHADLHVVDTDGECLNCCIVHWKEQAGDHA